MDTQLNLWSKVDRKSGNWLPLILHLLDAAAVAAVLLERKTQEARDRLAAALGLPWIQARPWLLLLVACHDLGKACPAFQMMWKEATQRLAALGLGTKSGQVHLDAGEHGFITQLVLEPLLSELGWPSELARLSAEAVGCHHGKRASQDTLRALNSDDRNMGTSDQIDQNWIDARREIFNALLEIFRPETLPTKTELNGPDFKLLASLVRSSDRNGSNTDWFPFVRLEDSAPLDLSAYFTGQQSRAESVPLDARGGGRQRGSVRGKTSLSLGENRTLALEVASGSTEARNKMIVGNTGYIGHLAKSFIRCYPSFKHLIDDLVGEGFDRLVEAIDIIARDKKDCKAPLSFIKRAAMRGFWHVIRREETMPIPRTTEKLCKDAGTPIEKNHRCPYREFGINDPDLEIAGLYDLIETCCHGPHERVLVEMRLAGHTIEEIAQATGMSVPKTYRTKRELYARALAKFGLQHVGKDGCGKHFTPCLTGNDFEYPTAHERSLQKVIARF